MAARPKMAGRLYQFDVEEEVAKGDDQWQHEMAEAPEAYHAELLDCNLSNAESCGSVIKPASSMLLRHQLDRRILAVISSEVAITSPVSFGPFPFPPQDCRKLPDRFIFVDFKCYLFISIDRRLQPINHFVSVSTSNKINESQTRWIEQLPRYQHLSRKATGEGRQGRDFLTPLPQGRSKYPP